MSYEYFKVYKDLSNELSFNLLKFGKSGEKKFVSCHKFLDNHEISLINFFFFNTIIYRLF